jgi:hypothetical protein
MFQATSPAMLFADKPTIPFMPELKYCPCCNARLTVLKTREKEIFTLHIGVLQTCESVLHCESCGHFANYGSEELLDIVPKGSRYGYDVMVYIGKAMFLRHRCNHEIMAELATRNIPISSGEIDYLAKKFIVYLAIAHSRNAEKIKTAMELNGGFILHLDSTCDKGSPMLMCGIDSISDIVLGSIKIASEKADFVVPFLRKIKVRFGNPLAVVQDMGKGIMNAVEEAFDGIRIFICHFHFLRDIGKDLFGDDYDVIRKRLRKHAIVCELKNMKKSLEIIIDENPHLIDGIYDFIEQGEIVDSALELMPIVSCYTLIHWILEGKKQGNGYGFPFDRTHVDFSKRLLESKKHIDVLKVLELKGNWKDNKPFHKLSCKLKKVTDDSVFKAAISRIQPKIEVFDKLRAAMRIAEPSGTKGLNDHGMDENMRTIKEKVTEFRHWMIEGARLAEDKDYTRFMAQLDKYWDKLFADPIEVETPSGKISIQPQRTNNIMEHFFRDLKRDNIRKTGNNSIGKTIRAMISDTPLVKNLENPDYMKIILGEKKTLEEVFALIDTAEVSQRLKESRTTDDKIPQKIKALIVKKDLPELITNSFKKRLTI